MGEPYECEVLVIGAGPAGLSASARAAECGAKVLLLDENPSAGGQIWRPNRGQMNPRPQSLLQLAWNHNFRQVNSATVFDLDTSGFGRASTPREAIEVKFQKVVLATGARELFIPFPGWTLPNVFGAGALQALVKSGLEVRGRRVVVAGSGPLIVEVADFLSGHGASVAGVFEQAERSQLARFGAGVLRHGSKLRQALGMLGTAAKVSPGSVVISAQGADWLESVDVREGSRSKRIECDYLACGFGLVPNAELAILAGCDLQDGFVLVDELQQTTVPNVLCAGEPTSIGGVGLSTVEGEIAGFVAAGALGRARELRPRLEKERAFAKLLKECFALRTDLKSLPQPDTIVCRCEDVTMGRLAGCRSAKEAKIYTRCGMGPCQGRVCGAANTFLFGWKMPTVHPPVTPVPLEDLAACAREGG